MADGLTFDALMRTTARPRTPTVEEVWEIDPRPDNPDWPFALKRTDAQGDACWFPCRSIEEAHDKLQAIATVLQQDGHRVELG